MQKTSIALILAASSVGAMQVNKSDADGLFKLMDANVTRGNLKNLVTDKPSPITVGLAQIESISQINATKSGNQTKNNKNSTDSNINGLDVSTSALKNIVTDEPSPLTEHNTNKNTVNASNSTAVEKITTSNITTPADTITINHNGTTTTVVNDLAQKKVVSKKDSKKKDDDKIDHILNGMNITVGALKGLITDKPAPLTEHNANKTKKNKDVSDAGVPHITTSNSSTGSDGVVITYAQTKTNVTASSNKACPDIDSGKRIDHTLGGVDVPKVALKGLVADATSPLTSGNVKTEE